MVWKKDAGEGFAGPIVASGKVILFHRVSGREIIEALDAATGKNVWSYEYPTAYRDDFGFDEGPRAAPVVANGVVYTFGAEGVLSAVDLATGKKRWVAETHKMFTVRKGWFGAAGSPVVEGGSVLVNVGAENAGIVAFDAGQERSHGRRPAMKPAIRLPWSRPSAARGMPYSSRERDWWIWTRPPDR